MQWGQGRGYDRLLCRLEQMKLYPIAIFTATLLMIMTAVQQQEPTNSRAGAPSISAKILIDAAGGKSLSVEVSISNQSDHEISLWDPTKWPGRDTLSFILHDPSGACIRIVRKEMKGDHQGKPSKNRLPAGETLEWRYDLLDGTWKFPEYLGCGNSQLLSAELDVAGGAKVDANKIWTGHIKSNQVALEKPIMFYCPFVVFPF